METYKYLVSFLIGKKMNYPAENVLKSVVSDIRKALVDEKVNIDSALVEYFVKLAALNPELGKCFHKNPTGENIIFFTNYCVIKLKDEADPAILMMKMQLNYEKEYDTLENLVLKNQDNIDKKTEPLVKEIFQAKPGTKEEQEKLLRRISIYLVLKSGLGNPGNIQVLREGTGALNSVFTVEDLKIFIEKNNQFKEKQLNELLSIVSGIRIFNRDCGKGGESIPELTTNLSEAAEATSLALSHCLIRIMERVNLLTTTLDAYLSINAETKTMQITLPEGRGLEITQYYQLCKILSLYRQYEILVRKLINDMDSLQVENKELCLNFSTHMFDLHALVRYRTAIPVDQVFPYFIQLWKFWRKMQNNMFLISAINNIMWKLDSVHEALEVPHTMIDTLLDGRRIISDAQRLQKTEDLKIDHTSIKCQVILLTDKYFGEFSYQYLGFCSLCICVGALIPANPNMGLLKWGQKYFVFCSPEHGKVFGINPNRYIKETLEYIRNNIEMINLLQVYGDLYAVKHMHSLIMKNAEIIKTDDKSTQTELHPIPTHIDKDYVWNIWEYKKKAYQLACLLNKRTHSTQTHESASKINATSQTAYSSTVVQKLQE